MVSDRSTLSIGLALTLVTMLIAAVLLFIGARYEQPLPPNLDLA
jgi:hypothetical protein